MKKLNRYLALQPNCLNSYTNPPNKWKGKLPTAIGKTEIWTEINKFQEKFCVYCESRAYQGLGTGHIEHFYDKGNSSYTHLTFDWNNLFGCCESNEHCGHYKDAQISKTEKRCPDHTKLLKPDQDDPEQFLQFVNTGGIKEKEGLNDDDFAKAQQTIKALNLNHPSLNSSRHGQIQRFKKQLEVLEQFKDSPIFESERHKIRQSIESEPYRTAIRQVLF